MDRSLWVSTIRRDIRRQARVVTGQELDLALEASMGREMRRVPMDRDYKVIPLELWERIIKRNRIDRLTYKAEYYDCDDFAFSLKGCVAARYGLNSIGLVIDWSGGHAYNVIFRSLNEQTVDVVWVEPQNDTLMDVGTARGMYKMQNGMVIV